MFLYILLAIIRVALLRNMSQLYQMLPANPSRQQWLLWVDLAYRTMYRARMDAFRATQQFYDSERGEPFPLSPRNFSPDDLVRMLEEKNIFNQLNQIPEDSPARTVDLQPGPQEIAILDGIPEGLGIAPVSDDARFVQDPTTVVPERVVHQINEVLERAAMDGSRQTLADATTYDPRAVGYARVDFIPPTCPFCILLISRGPVFRNERTAVYDSSGDPYHYNCTCTAVPVFNLDDWNGRDQYLAALRLYKESGSSLEGLREAVAQGG